MLTSQARSLFSLLRDRDQIRNFEADFDLATKIDLRTNEGGNFFVGVVLTPGYTSAINGMIDARKAEVSAGIAALGVTEDD